MKRRTWIKTVAAVGAAVLYPWAKRAKAVDRRDQTVRINKLRDRIAFRWGNDNGEVFSQSLALDRRGDESVQLYCDANHPDDDGKYSTATVAIKKRLARTMDDETLCRKLTMGLLRSSLRGHRVGFFAVDEPPPEWITS